MAYADYEYYAGTYMGTVSEDAFPRLAVRASSFLDYFTQGRAQECPGLDALKMCCCALVDKYQLIETAQEMAANRLLAANAGSAEVKSEQVGGYSRTLSTGGESATAALSSAQGARTLLADVCREYLGNTGLLYRGGGRTCTLPTR